jgi:hypothetical protein
MCRCCPFPQRPDSRRAFECLEADALVHFLDRRPHGNLTGSGQQQGHAECERDESTIGKKPELEGGHDAAVIGGVDAPF